MMLVLSVLNANALVFGSLPRSSYKLPPIKIRSVIDPSHHIFIAPTNRHCSTLACCEDRKESNVTHYFVYADHTLHRCIWRAPTTSNEKAVILSRMRKWYKLASNYTLGASLLEEDDMYAWVCSHVNDLEI